MDYEGRRLQEWVRRRRRRTTFVGWVSFVAFLAVAACMPSELGTSLSATKISVIAVASVIFLMCVAYGLKMGRADRMDQEFAATLPRGEGLPTLVDAMYDWYIYGENGLFEKHIVLLQNIDDALGIMERGSESFDSQSQERLAYVIRRFFWVGAMGKPEIFDLVTSLTRSFLMKATSPPALKLVGHLGGRRAWLPYQKRMRAMVHEARQEALLGQEPELPKPPARGARND
jgi:hypothetical protein